MAMEMFARIGTIKGESLDRQHRDEIDALTWSWGVAQRLRPGHSGRVGKPTFEDFVFTHRFDKASPQLMQACALGQHIADATITVRHAGEPSQDFLVITLTDVLVSSVSSMIDAEADVTGERVVLAFDKVDLECRARDPKGASEPGVHFVHDLRSR